jgi:hypothetical protein
MINFTLRLLYSWEKEALETWYRRPGGPHRQSILRRTEKYLDLKGTAPQSLILNSIRCTPNLLSKRSTKKT